MFLFFLPTKFSYELVQEKTIFSEILFIFSYIKTKEYIIAPGVGLKILLTKFRLPILG